MIASILLASALCTVPEATMPAGWFPAQRALSSHFGVASSTAPVGSWVMYRMSGGPGRTHFWRMAVVGEDKAPDGSDALWIETELGSHPSMASPLFQLRVLTSRRAGFQPDGIHRMLVGFGAEKPRELSREAMKKMLEEGPAPSEARVAPTNATLTHRPETVLVTGGGTVKAIPIEVRYQQVVMQRVWLSPQVPLLHVAKLEMPATGHTIELEGFGQEAVARMRLPEVGAPMLQVEASR